MGAVLGMLEGVDGVDELVGQAGDDLRDVRHPARGAGRRQPPQVA